MELGNMLFGNSRGEFRILRGAGWEEELIRLFDAYAPDRDQSWREYGIEFENDTFHVMPYWWGECTCNLTVEDLESHSEDCRLIVDNFYYKPTGFGIQWYKYPLRDSYCNEKITLEDFKNIINVCIASLDKTNES